MKDQQKIVVKTGERKTSVSREDARKSAESIVDQQNKGEEKENKFSLTTRMTRDLKDKITKSEPELIKAGSPLLRLGANATPPKVDCRVVAEERYQEMLTESKQLQQGVQELEKVIQGAMNIVDLWKPNDSIEAIKECHIGDFAALSMMRQSFEKALGNSK